MRPAGVAARALGSGLVFVAALVAGVPLHLDLPAARRLVASAVNRVLAPLLVGRITIERVAGLGLGHIEGVDARLEDASGRTVLRVEGVSARVATAILARSALGRAGDVRLLVTDASVARAEATLEQDEAGEPAIAGLFRLRTPGPAPAANRRAFSLSFARVKLGAASVAVRPRGGRALDVQLHDAEAKCDVGPKRFSLEVTRAPLRVAGLPGDVPVDGELAGQVETPSLRGHARWRGAVGGIESSADAAYVDGQVDGSLDVLSAAPDLVRAVWPACPFAVPANVHVEAHGTLPKVHVRARAGLGTASLELAGPLVLRGKGEPSEPLLRANLKVEAEHLDARALAPGAPSSDFALAGDVSVVSASPGRFEGKATIDVGGGTLNGVRLPPAVLEGYFARSEAGEPSGQVEVTVRDPVSPTAVAIRLVRAEPALVVAFEATSRVPHLERLWPLAGAVNGSADANASGVVDFGARTVRARLSAGLSLLSTRGARLRHAQIQATAEGPLDHPPVDFEVDGEDLEAGVVRLSALHARATLAVDGPVTLRHLELDAAAQGPPIQATVSLVRWAPPGGVSVEGATIEGLGEPIRATAHSSPSGLLVQASTPGIELERLAEFAGLPVGKGHLSFDVDGSVNQQSASGRVVVALEHATLRDFDDATVRVDAMLDGRRGSGRIQVDLPDLGTFEVRSSAVHVGAGPLLTAAPWRGAWGAVEFQAKVALDRLAARFAPRKDVAGNLEVAGQIERDDARDATPAVELTAHTVGLAVGGLSASGPWRLAGLDPVLHATVDGDTGRTAVRFEVGDRAGAIAKVEATSSEVPYAVVFSGDDPVPAFRRMPFDATLELFERKINSLPPVMRVGNFEGELQAKVSWHGSVEAPHVDAAAEVKGTRTDRTLLSLPVDLSVGAHYDGAKVDATVRALAREHEVFSGSANVQAKALDVLAAMSGAPLPWTASASAKLDRFPLQRIPFLGDRQVRGTVSGEAVLDGLHANASARTTLVFDRLQLGDVLCQTATLSARLSEGAFDANVRLDHGDGFAAARAHSGARWGAAYAPTLDPSQAADASILAQRFRAAALLPFVSKWFVALDGRIDADGRVRLSGSGAAPEVSATLTLADATFEHASFGGEFHNVAAKLTLTPDGVLRVADATARGVSGRLQAAATARLEGTSLVGVRATLVVPSSDPLPLIFDGLKLGMLDGRFDIAADRNPADHGLDVTVAVPQARIGLPTSASSLDVQSLGQIDGVTVGIVRRPGDFVAVPLDGAVESTEPSAATRQAPVRVNLQLGDVQVSRGTDVDVRLQGEPTINLAGETRVSGQIRMVRGTLDVQGKPFSIDRGTVTFVGSDATNPQIVLTASWGAPDGTVVYADFVGPLRTGKVKLRSEPAMPQSQILALVLFGSADGQPSTGGGLSGQATTVAAAAGGAATAPINRALGGLDRALDNLGLGGGISTKIDTSQVNPRPEVEVQIARDISLQIAWVLGVPPPGTNPDSTLVTLNWHFLHSWSLQTTVGDAGTSIVDLVWQHHY